MRIMGFSKKDWKNYLTGRPKLEEPEFTTFRFPRKDRDWAVGEQVQVVYKPRRKGGGEHLGIAEIVGKLPKAIEEISEFEAKADGFSNGCEMWIFLGKPSFSKTINKLTLRWVAR